jgi:alpha-galactosidase
MKTVTRLLPCLLAVLFSLTGCRCSLPDADLAQAGVTELAAITVDGQPVAFSTDSPTSRKAKDVFGTGCSLVFRDKSVIGLERRMTVTKYEDFPGTLVVRVEYRNTSKNALAVDGWSVCRLKMVGAGDEPCFWSFQGQSTEERADWILPVEDGFYQKNYMGMNDPDYGGGIPVVCLWRKDAGVMVGHLETHPELVSLPVSKKAGENFATVGIEKEYDTPFVLAPGASLKACTSFISVFTGDCFQPLRTYAQLLAKEGVVMPESEPYAFEPAWCAWGYERRFTVDEILGTLPKVKELGFKWATLDDGYQIAEGDWDLTPDSFPGGDEQMEQLVEKIHSYGLKAELWWAPLAADPGTAFLAQYPSSVILDKEGRPQVISWWDSWYLSPLDPDVIREQKALVSKFIGQWGFDGLKLDGQHMNAVAPDYNPAHHPDDPEKDVRELPSFYKMIYDTARKLNPHAVLQYCPCGDCFSVFNLPYVNKTVSSDPGSSWQIRTKGYVLRAIAPKTAYYGDHIELSDGEDDYPTHLGIGAVPGSKFTWPEDNPYVRHSYKLTPEKEAKLKHALDIYAEKQLSKGEIVAGLYDVGYDNPETYVIRKDGMLHYAFYARNGEKVTSVELRGLEPGCRYQVTDYYNQVDYGVVTAAEQTILPVAFDQALLLEVRQL